MINSIFKAFSGRAGWLPSLLALVIIALIGTATVMGLPRIEQNIEQQIRHYLETNLSDRDSLVSFQVSGRDVLLAGQISDPAAIRSGMVALSGVRRVTINGAKSIGSRQVNSESADNVNLKMPDASTDESGVEAEMPASASLEPSDGSASSLGQTDPAIANIIASGAATSTEQAAPDDVLSPASEAQAGNSEQGYSKVERAAFTSDASPEALIRSLNALVSASVIFSPGVAQVSAEFASALLPLVGMMKNNPDFVLGIEGYPDHSVASDKSAFVGFVRARNIEKFLLEQQVQDQRIYTRYLPGDQTSADDGAQLKFYILK